MLMKEECIIVYFRARDEVFKFGLETLLNQNNKFNIIAWTL